MILSPRFNGTLIVQKQGPDSALLTKLSAQGANTDNAGRFMGITGTQNMQDDLSLLEDAKTEGRRAFYLPQNLNPTDLRHTLENLSHLDALDKLVQVVDPQQQRRRELLLNRLFDFVIENVKNKADLLQRIGEVTRIKR